MLLLLMSRPLRCAAAGYLFYRSVQAANKASEQMDKLDGY